ncbi:unnamed protein product [Cunninghamella echinulata]
MMQRAKQLQMQGAQEDTNPELAHIMQILRSIQQPKKPPQSTATDIPLQTLNNSKEPLSSSSSQKLNLLPYDIKSWLLSLFLKTYLYLYNYNKLF